MDQKIEQPGGERGAGPSPMRGAGVVRHLDERAELVGAWILELSIQRVG